MSNIIEGKLHLDNKTKIAVITTRINHIITDRLVEGAKDSFLRHGGNPELFDIVITPGAFDIPFVFKKVLDRNYYMGVCCVGAIIRGSTPNFDYVAAETIKGIAQTMLKYDTPTTYGVLTTDTLEQAIARAGSKIGNKGFEAMSSLIEIINLLSHMPK